ncbi:MAG: hypothetical protein WAU49_00625 [Steroidobacteraceae bacterium]
MVKAGLGCLVPLLVLLGAAAGVAHADEADLINAAIPLSGSAQTAVLQMRRLVRDGSLRAGIEAQLALRMRLRALTCGQSLEIPLGLSSEQVHNRYGGDPCFAKQDDDIADWLGLRTVGSLLALSALRPMPAFAPQSVADAVAPIQRAYFATAAGVAAVSSYRDVEVVDLALGVPINTRFESTGAVLLSIAPNGRVYLARQRGVIRFYDSEDGTLIAQPEWCLNAIDCGFHWLDERTALIEDPATRAPALYDFRSGTTGPFDGDFEPVSRVAPVPGAAATFVAFRNSGITEFKLIFAADGRPHAQVMQVERYRLNLIPVETGGPAAGGRQYVNTSSGKLVITDLTDLRTESLDLGGLSVERVLPTSDPDTVIIVGFVRGGPPGLQLYEYALRERTLSPLDTGTLPSTLLVYDAPQNALFVQAGAALSRVGNLPVGKPVSPAALSADVPVPRPPPLPPRPGVYAMPPGVAVTTSGGMITGIFAPPPPEPLPGPVSRLARNSDVEGIGIFGSDTPDSGAAGKGVVQVTIPARQNPLVLVLSSYSGVEWHLNVKPDAHLTAVLLTGPHGSTVQGQGHVPVVAIGSMFSYVVGSPGYGALQNEVYIWTGKRMGLFQCGQRANQFTVY